MSAKQTASAETGGPIGLPQPCRVCGAEARADSDLCASCAGTIAPDADAPLPPIPDGGLAESMPTWLKQPAHTTDDRPSAAPLTPPALDVSAILRDDDLPTWLKRIADRQTVGHPSDTDTALAATPDLSQPDLVSQPDVSAAALAEPSTTALSNPAALSGHPAAELGTSLPPLPSSLTRPAPTPRVPRPSQSNEVKDRLVGAALAIAAIIILVMIFIL